MERPSHVNIDGDIILYAVGFAAQRTVYLSDGKTFEDKRDVEEYAKKYDTEIETAVQPEPVEHCLSSVKRLLARIVEGSGCSTHTVLLSGSTNFRTSVAKLQEYKGNRISEKPYHYLNIRNYLVDVKHAEIVEGEEADDQLSVRCVQQGHMIATIDKDLRNTAGWHFNWDKDEEPVEINEVEADRNFYTQLLTGDSTDNIPGLFKLTGKRATAKSKAPIQEMTDPADMYKHVYKVYADAECANVADTLLEIGRLLWMRREDGETWTPPTEVDNG